MSAYGTTIKSAYSTTIMSAYITTIESAYGTTIKSAYVTTIKSSELQSNFYFLAEFGNSASDSCTLLCECCGHSSDAGNFQHKIIAII